MTAMPEFPDLEQLQAEIDDQVIQAEKAAEQAKEFAEKAQKLTAVTRSQSRDVAVEVDAAGVVIDLLLTSEAMRRKPDALSHQIVSLIHEAHRQVTASYVGMVQRTFGESETAKLMIEQARQRLGSHGGTTKRLSDPPPEMPTSVWRPR